jgi:DNA repair protein RadD
LPAQQLRPYQQDGLNRILAAWKAGARTQLGVLPTAGGKTTLFTHLASEIKAPVLLLVHRRELAEQAANRLREFGVDFGYIMSGEQPKPYARVQVASVQTLVKRKAPRAGLVICDEAHLSTAATWSTILDNYPRARILGVTATPWRLAGKPLVGAYDACTVIATPAQLRQQGYLCPYVGFSYLAPDLSDVKTTGGDYNEHQSAEAMKAPQIVDSVVREWKAHASELSTAVFAVTVEHSQQLCDEFRAAGVRAEHLDGSTPLDQRRAILRRVGDGTTRVLCNVGVAVEGLDIPRLKCIVLARPTKSLARYIQMVGRGRRPWNGLTCRIHDHAFNLRLHGLPDADRDYSLSAKPEKPPSLSRCECGAYTEPGQPCRGCGKERESEPAGERILATVPDAEQFSFSSEDVEPTPASADDLPPVPVRWENPREIEGRLTGVTEEKTDYGAQKLYALTGPKRRYTLPGTAQLNHLMSKVEVGAYVWVNYIGRESSNRGRHLFKVEVDDGT